MAHDVFISYSSEDENVVRAVSNALEANKIRCWYASRDIPAGADWPTSIVNAIQEAQALLLIFTDFANASEHVLREVTTAISDGKTLIPFKLTSNGPTEGMKYFLNTVHWLDAVDQPLEDAIDNLVKRVKIYIDTDTSTVLADSFRGGSSDVNTFGINESDTDTTNNDTSNHHESSHRESNDVNSGGNTPEIKKWLFAALTAVLAVCLLFAFKPWNRNIIDDKLSTPAATEPAVVTNAPSKNASAAPAPIGNSLGRLMDDVFRTDGKDAEADRAAAEKHTVFTTGLTRSQIGTITFLDSLKDAPEDARDFSADIDGRVLGWSIKNENSGLYNLYIAGEGGIAAPTNCTGLFEGYTNLAEIDFGNVFHTDSTTSMCQMFAYCPALSVLDLSGFKTKNVTDMSRMFVKDSALRKITFGPQFDTSMVSAMFSMFFGCERLEVLDVSGFNTSNATTMAKMFYGCSKLSALDVSGFDTAKVTDMSYMFNKCSSLSTLDITRFNTSAVTAMKGMFQHCSGLKELDVSGFDTAKVTDMSWMFCNCSSLSTLDVSGFVTSLVANMRSMFDSCSGLTELDVSGFDTAKVTDMSFMFNKCSSLSTLDVSRFNTSAVTAMKGMFQKCRGLKELDVSSFDTAKVKDMSYMFSDCTGLSSLNVSDFGTSNVESYESFMPDSLNPDWRSMFTDSVAASISAASVHSKKTDTQTPLSGIGNILMEDVLLTDNDTEIAQSAAQEAHVFNMPLKRAQIETITFLNSLKDAPKTAFDLSADINGSVKGWTIKNNGGLYDLYIAGEGGITAPVDCTGLFEGYINLKAIEFGSAFFTGQMTSMRQMFAYCPNLSVLDLSGFDTSRVTDMSQMFVNDTSLRKVSFGEQFDSSRVKAMYSMFYNCENLEIVNTGVFRTPQVTSMAKMFYGCSSIKSLDVSGFDTSNVVYMSWMFSGCSNLTDLDVSNFDTANVTSMRYMFENCNSLQALDVSRFDTSAVTDMACMFKNCVSLLNLDVSNFDTGKVTNMGWMFYRCSSLQALDVSCFDTSAVTDMACMFCGCSALSSLDVSAFNTAKVTTMNALFRDCSSVRILDVSSFITSNVTNMYCMFYACRALSSLDVSSFDTSRVTNMAYMFGACSGLSELNLSNFDTSNVTEYDYFMSDSLNPNWRSMFVK